MTIRASRDKGKCPVAFGMDIFGDRWSLVILRDMFFKRKRFYGEFLQSDEKISTNILADRLAKMDAEGLISKTRDQQNQSRFIYQLTGKGKDLLPVLMEIVVWSAKYDPQPNAPDHIIAGAPADLLRRWAEDRPALLAEILAAIA